MPTNTNKDGSLDWRQIQDDLAAPFDAAEVDWRVQGKANEQTGKGQVVAYIDARAVQDRLDSVVGTGNWSFDWTPVVIKGDNVEIAKGTITIYGVSKSDAGSASNFEQTLGAVSHCFKRAAVHWGVGRYLYNIPSQWVQVEKGGRLSPAVKAQLRRVLEGGVSPEEERERTSPGSGVAATKAGDGVTATNGTITPGSATVTMRPALHLNLEHLPLGTTPNEIKQFADANDVPGPQWAALWNESGRGGNLPKLWTMLRIHLRSTAASAK